MDKHHIADRTKKFAVDTINFCGNLPKNEPNFVIRKQLIKSSTSVGANYRAAIRSRSKAEFFAKICIVLEEADESLYWLELIETIGMSQNTQFNALKDEATQLVKIFSTTRKTARNN